MFLSVWIISLRYRTLAYWLECSPMAWERFGFNSRLIHTKKWYLKPHYLAQSIIRYGSRVNFTYFYQFTKTNSLVMIYYDFLKFNYSVIR